MISMGERVRMAGAMATPMLVNIQIQAAVQAGMALEALGDGIEPPDLEEVERRIGNVLRLLLTGAK